MSKKLRVNVHVNPSEVFTGTDQNVSLNIQENTSWSDVCKLIKEKLNFLTTSLAFQYLDEDADYISGCTEEEWKDAIAAGSTKSRDELVLHIKAVPTENVTKKPVGCDQSSNIKSACCFSDPWCCYERPMPDNPTFDGTPREKIVNPQSSSYKYANEALQAVALPLGPIGGGCIAVAGDGGLRQWQVVNQVNHLGHVPNSFFAIKVESDSETPAKSVVLQSNTWYDLKNFKPANYITDQVVPEASKVLLETLPGVKTVEVTAKYPIVEVDVTSDEVPVHVSLEAFNPCIPLNTNDSAIPMIIFNYTVTNPSDKAVKVTMLSSLLNFIGWNGQSVISQNNVQGSPGGNHNTLYTFGRNIDTDEITEYEGMSGYYGIYMNNTTLESDASLNGDISIGVFHKSGDVNECFLQFTDAQLTQMWKDFTTNGLEGQGAMGASAPSTTWLGALSCCREVPAQKSETFTFVLSWHFPNRYCSYVNWAETATSKSRYYLGNYYNTLWKSVKEVVSYTGQKIGMLTKMTRKFRDTMFDSTLPWHLIDSAAGRVSVMRSPTFFYCEDENLYCYEGCSTTSGCCPMNCTHVLNYEMAIARCFPDLERNMRTTDLIENMAPNGIIPSRTVMPLMAKREWESWDWYSPDNVTDLASTRICLDGDLGTVLKTYREIRQFAPEKFVVDTWPRIKLMMRRYMDKLDRDAQGLITGAQPCTYDRATFGVDTFIGCLYLCALRAAEEMAKLMNEPDLAAQYHDRFCIGSKNLDELCFQNEKWYTQIVVSESHEDEQLGCGTFIDALIGQWWAYSLGLGPLLPRDHMRSHLKWVFKRNHVDAFSTALQRPRVFYDEWDKGLHMTYWDVEAGEKVPRVPLLYSYEGAWNGLEHTFAGLLLYENITDIGYQVVEECRAKYDGTRRSPWNEIECGDHYARSMAAFLYFEIASGMTWNIYGIATSAIDLNFAPICNSTVFNCFFIVGSGWGSYTQTVKENTANVELSVAFGDVEIVTLGLALNFKIAKTVLVKADHETEEIKTTVAQENGKITLSFPDAPVQTLPSGSKPVLIVDTDDTLQITLS